MDLLPWATENGTDPVPAQSCSKAGDEIPGWRAPGSVSSGRGAL